MTPCPACHAQPVLEQRGARFRYTCPNSTRRPVRLGFAGRGCEAATDYWNTTEGGARRSWEREVGAPMEHCPRCGLRGSHECLSGDALARDGSRSWWSERKSNHKYTDEETVIPGP
jgi:hypothetical protein